MGLALLSGCALQRDRPLEPAFADAAVLTRGHPGYGQLQAVQGEIASLRRAAGATVPVGFPLEPTVLEPFGGPVTVAEGSGQRMESAIAAEMRLAERQLRRQAKRRLAQEAETLEAAARQAIAAERARLDDLLSRRRREIELRYRGPQTKLDLKLQAAERWLDESPLAVGERTRAELQRAAAEGELKALRARKGAEIEAAECETRSALEAFAAARKASAAQALAAARERSEREVARQLQQRRETLLEEATTALTPSPAPQAGTALSLPVGERPPAPPVGPQAAAVKVGDDIARLERLRARLGAVLSEQTRAAAILVARRHGFEIKFEHGRGRPAPDLTARLQEWLDDYWQAGAGP